MKQANISLLWIVINPKMFVSDEQHSQSNQWMAVISETKKD
jgi:hypothetical protein